MKSLSLMLSMKYWPSAPLLEGVTGTRARDSHFSLSRDVSWAPPLWREKRESWAGLLKSVWEGEGRVRYVDVMVGLGSVDGHLLERMIQKDQGRKENIPYQATNNKSPAQYQRSTSHQEQ